MLSRDVHCILGLPFDSVNLEQSVNHVYESIENNAHSFLSTPNLNFSIATQTDQQFFQSVIDSDLSVADGMPLIWVAKLLGIPITERVAGSSLFELLSKQRDRTEKIKVFFFGGQEGIAEVAHQQLNKTSQGMISCGFYDPGFVSVDEMSSAEIINTINNTSPDFVVVALGAKKGQQWIQKNRGQLTAKVTSHLGAVINFVAGHVERAPVFWQRYGLEWLWRIRQEPNLWKRYLFDGLAFTQLLFLNVLPLAIYDRYLKRSEAYSKPVVIDYVEPENVVRISGSMNYVNLMPLKQAFADILMQGGEDVTLDCSQLDYIDSAFIASLLLFQRYLDEQKRQLTLCNVPKRIKRLLRLNSVLMRFQIID